MKQITHTGSDVTSFLLDEKHKIQVEKKVKGGLVVSRELDPTPG